MVAQETSESSPRLFAGYELLEEIGQDGAMGAVYRARDTASGRIVALKMLRADRLRSEELVRRFQIEIEASAHLDHPHVLPIYDVGEHHGQHYFTMRLATGGSLARQINEGRWSMPSADRTAARERQRSIAKLVKAVAEGVQHAHERGVLHRDLKPGNILLDDDGRAYVSDFGLAKQLNGDSELTRTHGLVGTPAYMAPEQTEAGGKNVTARTDVWALGAILYELLIGRVPFEGAGPMEVLERLRTQEPISPRAIIPMLDLDLTIICLKCLEKDPAHRYESAAELAIDLGCFLGSQPIAARPSTQWETVTKWWRRNPVIAPLASGLVMVLLVGLAVTGWLWSKTKTANTTLATSNANLRSANDSLRDLNRSAARADRSAALDRIHEGKPRQALALLARGIRYREESELTAQLAIDVLHNHSVRLPDTTFGPDEITSGDLRLVKHGTLSISNSANHVSVGLEGLNGGNTIVSQAKFSGDGHRIALHLNNKHIGIWDARTGARLAFASLTMTNHQYLIVSHDGASLACIPVLGDGNLGPGLEVISLHGHNLGGLRIGDPNETFIRVSWNRDGTRLATISSFQIRRIFDIVNGKELYSKWDNNGQFSGHDMPWMGTFEMAPNGHWLAWLQVFGNYEEMWVLPCAFTNSTAPIPVPVRLNSEPMDMTEKRMVFFHPSSRWVGTSYLKSELTGLFDLSKFGTNGVSNELRSPLRVNARILAFSRDGYLVLAESPDHRLTVNLWDWHRVEPTSLTTNGELNSNWTRSAPRRYLRVLFELAPAIDETLRASLCFDDVGATIMTGTQRVPYSWSTISPTESTLMEEARRAVAVAMDRAGDHCILALSDGSVSVWDVNRGHKQFSLRHQTEGLRSCAYSPDDRSILTLLADGSAHLWDSQSGLHVSEIVTGISNACAIFSPDGREVVTVTDSVDVWDPRSGKRIRKIPFGEIKPTAASLDGQKHYLAVASTDGVIRVLDFALGTEIARLNWTSGVAALIFSADGNTLYARGPEGDESLVSSWDWKSAKLNWSTASGGSSSGIFLMDSSPYLNADGELLERETGKKIYRPAFRGVLNFKRDPSTISWNLDRSRWIRIDHYLEEYKPVYQYQVGAMKPAEGPPPPWFAAFLEQVAWTKVDDDGSMAEFDSTGEFNASRQPLLDSLATDSSSLAEFAKSILHPRPDSIIQPSGQGTVWQVADALIVPGAGREQLEKAHRLLPAHPLIALALSTLETDPWADDFGREYSLKHAIPRADPAL